MQVPSAGETAEMQQQQAAGQLQQRYPVDVVAPASRGLLVRVLPQRDLRELQLCWYIPAGVMAHSRCAAAGVLLLSWGTAISVLCWMLYMCALPCFMRISWLLQGGCSDS